MKPNPASVIYAALLSTAMLVLASCEDPTYDPNPKDWGTEFDNHIESARSNEPAPSRRYLKEIEAAKARKAGEHLAILDQNFGIPTEVTIEKFYCESCQARFYDHELDGGTCPRCYGNVSPSPEKKTGPRFREP